MFLFLLTVFSLMMNIDGSTIGFVGSTVNTGTTSFGAVVTVTTFNVFVNTALDGNVVRVTQRNVFEPRRFCFRRLVYVFLTIVMASMILLSVFGSLKVPASAAMSVMFRLLKNAFILTLVGVTKSRAKVLKFTSLLGARGTLSIVLNVFLSMTMTFFFNALMRCLSHLLFAFGCAGGLGCAVKLFNNVTIATVVCFVLVGNLGSSTFVAARGGR